VLLGEDTDTVDLYATGVTLALNIVFAVVLCSQFGLNVAECQLANSSSVGPPCYTSGYFQTWDLENSDDKL
jgi:hypothetical protein